MAKWFNKQDFIIQVILMIIPVTNWIIGSFYRISKGKLVFGIIWLFTAGIFGIGLLVDFITVLVNKKIQVLV